VKTSKGPGDHLIGRGGGYGFYPGVKTMLFLWVKILHQNLISFHFACKNSFFVTIQHKNIVLEKKP